MKAGTAPRNPTLGRVALGLAPATIAVQVFSFISSVALATVLGATRQTDAYYLALSVPFVVYGILLGAIRLGAIPALARLLEQKPEAYAEASSELSAAVIVAATALAAATTLAAFLVIGGVAGKHGDPALARLLVLELAPYGVLGAAAGVLGAVLTVRGRMIAPVAILAFEPIVKTILVLALGHAIGVQALVLGNLVGSGTGVAFLIWLLRSDGVRIRLTRPTLSPFVRGVLLFSVPLLLSQTILYANPLIDRATASAVGPGSVTQFELGFRIFGVPSSLLASTLIAPVTAAWSLRFARDGWPAVSSSLRRALSAMLAVVPMIVAAGVVLREQIVSAMYHGGAYSAHDISRTADVLAMLLLGLPAQVAGVALASMFVVRGQTLFMLKIAVINVILNAALDLWLRGPLGVGGIALSTSITYGVLVLAYCVAAVRRFGELEFKRLLIPLLRALASAAVVAGVTREGLAIMAPSTGRWSSVLAVVVLGLVAVVVHLTILGLTREEHATQVIGHVRAWLSRRPLKPGAATGTD